MGRQIRLVEGVRHYHCPGPNGPDTPCLTSADGWPPSDSFLPTPNSRAGTGWGQRGEAYPRCRRCDAEGRKLRGKRRADQEVWQGATHEEQSIAADAIRISRAAGPSTSVYVLEEQGGAPAGMHNIKIGKATGDPQQSRMVGLQTGNHRKLLLLEYVTIGSAAGLREKQLQRKFAKYHIGVGLEWFCLPSVALSELLRDIRRLLRQHVA